MKHLHGELGDGRTHVVLDIPAGTSAITLRGKTGRKGFLYAFLLDSNGLLRLAMLLSDEPKYAALTADTATSGALPGPLPAGEWRLWLYNIEGEASHRDSVDYELELRTDTPPAEAVEPVEITMNTVVEATHSTFDLQRVYNDRRGWYRGDFHAHTQVSDGHNTMAQAVTMAAEAGLDFLFLTDHNIIHPQLPEYSSGHCPTLFLPAVEITTDCGHCNLFAPRLLPQMDDFPVEGSAIVQEALRLATQEPTLLSINHSRMRPWHWRCTAMPLSRIDLLEICCDPSWPTSERATDRALHLFSRLWNAGVRIYGVGGSDSHLRADERYPGSSEPSVYGNPTTCVFAEQLSGMGIVQGVRAGHSWIERLGCRLRVEFRHLQEGTEQPLLPGEGLHDGSVRLRVDAEEAQLFFAELVRDGRVIERKPLPATFSAAVESFAWLRVDIRRGELTQSEKAQFAAMINPVYNAGAPRFAAPSATTWGDLMVQEDGTKPEERT